MNERQDIIIDIGANHGLFGCVLAKRNPHCKVIAIEPEPTLSEEYRDI
jgi:FkbM family methyltransferase